MEDNFRKEKKKKILVITSIVAILVIAIGATYAFYTYSNTGLESKLIAGDIYMRYREGSVLNISGAMPSATYPDSATGNYFEFYITGKNTSSQDISYTLKLAYGDEETGKDRIDDQYLYFKLVEVINGQEDNDNPLVLDGNFDSIPGSTLWTTTIPRRTMSETTRTFRLYARIGEEVGIGTNTTYTIEEWNNLYASIMINAEGNIKTPTGAEMLISTYGTENAGGLVGINANGELYNQNATGTSTTNNNALTNNLVNRTNEATVSRTDNTTTIREYRYSGNSVAEANDNETSAEDNSETPSETSPENQSTEQSETLSENQSTEQLETLSENQSTQPETSSENQSGGTNGGVRNYIWFNDEYWRIVGIFDKKDDIFENGNDEYVMKIVRNNPLSNVPSTYTNLDNKKFQLNSGENPYNPNRPYSRVYWNYDSESNYNNDWTTAGLMYYLNDDNTGSYYNSILGSYKSFIDTTTYYLGNVDSNNSTPQDFYADERGATVCDASIIYNSNENDCNIWENNSTTWPGKIGLLYPSDYAYSYPTSDWNSGNYTSDNWINGVNTSAGYYSWFLSPSASSGYDVKFGYDYEIGGDDAGSDYGVTPVLYLKSDTTILSGDGSYTSPYRIVAE